MRYIVAYITVLSIVFFQFSELVIFVSFKIKQDYITKNLCIEKDIEGSSCKGCCQLKKQITKHQKQKEELPPNLKDKQDIQFFCAGSDIFDKRTQLSNLMTIEYVDYYQYLANFSIFHPPRIIG